MERGLSVSSRFVGGSLILCEDGWCQFVDEDPDYIVFFHFGQPEGLIEFFPDDKRHLTLAAKPTSVTMAEAIEELQDIPKKITQNSEITRWILGFDAGASGNALFQKKWGRSRRARFGLAKTCLNVES